jgi:hypothetical protein
MSTPPTLEQDSLYVHLMIAGRVFVQPHLGNVKRLMYLVAH